MNAHQKFLQYFKMAVFYFLLYSFLGWIIDSSYSSLVDGQIVLGGLFKSLFIPLPLAPIYGVGALILIIFRKFLEKQHDFILAVIAGIIGTMVEYSGGVWMTQVFNRRAWDYSNNFLNLHGHIDLWQGFLWMLLGWTFVRLIHPLGEKTYKRFFVAINKRVIFAQR